MSGGPGARCLVEFRRGQGAHAVGSHRVTHQEAGANARGRRVHHKVWTDGHGGRAIGTGALAALNGDGGRQSGCAIRGSGADTTDKAGACAIGIAQCRSDIELLGCVWKQRHRATTILEGRVVDDLRRRSRAVAKNGEGAALDGQLASCVVQTQAVVEIGQGVVQCQGACGVHRKGDS